MSINASDFAKAVSSELAEYAADITTDVKKSVKEVAKDTVREVKKRSPSDSGAYRKSWRADEVDVTRFSQTMVIHDKTHYRLTHLLENGHALVGGGRTKAQPHIKPAEEFAEHELMRKIEIKIRG